MKNITRIITLTLTLILLGALAVLPASAADFRDYYPEPSYVYGAADNDCDVNVKDATLVQKYLAKIVELDEDTAYYADVNSSGDVTISDATLIQKYVAYIIEYFPADNIQEDIYYTIGERIEIEIAEDDMVLVNFTVVEEGFYDITATPQNETNVTFYVRNIESDNMWFSVTDGESSFCYGLFEEGDYEVAIYSEDFCDVKTSFVIEKSNDQPLFDTDDAEELKLGDRVELKADGSLKVFKVDITAIRDTDDVYYIHTEGENTQANITVYSEVYAVIGECLPLSDDGNNVGLYVFDDYVSSWSYIVVECYEDGEDFTLCCENSEAALDDMAEKVTLGNVYDIEIEFYEGSSEDEVAPQGTGSALYSFTPENSGYYSLEYSHEGYLFVLHGIEGFENSEDNDLVFSRQTNEGIIKDVRYFEAHTTYYIAIITGTETDGVVKFELGTSTEEEYNQIRLEEDQMFPEEEESTFDEIEFEEIGLNQTVEIELDSPENKYKGFKFTAEEDSEIVLYSEGSVDAYVEIYDSEDSIIYVGDDTFVLDNFDFTVKGTMKKGETCYFWLGTYSEDTDSYTFSVVSASDYEPKA